MTSSPVHFAAADRIADFKPYFFAQLTKKFADLKARGVDVIRIDMGSPDLPRRISSPIVWWNLPAVQTLMATRQMAVHRLFVKRFVITI